ncbi:hypothetical protein ACWGIU_26915 [Streptomyces sp. NPDC054840]
MSPRITFALFAVIIILLIAGFAALLAYLFNRDTGTPTADAAKKGAFVGSATLLALVALVTFFILAGGLEKEAAARPDRSITFTQISDGTTPVALAKVGHLPLSSTNAPNRTRATC